MIIRLSTIQISDHWEVIKNMLKRAVPDLPGQFANRDNNILRSLLVGSSICWVGYKRTAEKQNDIIGMMLTRMSTDELTGIRTLLVYCLAGWNIMSDRFYREGFISLKKYGENNHCNRITFYSDESRILDLTEKLGFNNSLRFGVYQL